MKTWKVTYIIDAETKEEAIKEAIEMARDDFDKKFDEGKKVVISLPEIDYVLVHWPNNVCTPWVAAWAYNEEGGYWGQGHYFTTCEGAMKYLKEKLDEKNLDPFNIFMNALKVIDK